MAIVTREFVYQTMRNTNKIYWDVKEGNNIYATYNINKGDIDESELQLMNALDQIEGYVDITLSSRTKQEKGEGGAIKDDIRLRVKCSPGTSAAAPSQPNVSGFIGELKGVYQQLADSQKQLADIRHQQEMKLLTDKIDALSKRLDEEDDDEEEQPNYIGQIRELLKDPMVQGAFSKLTGVPVPDPVTKLNGIDADTTDIEHEIIVEKSESDPELKKVQAKKCGEACGRLLKIDGGAGDALLMMAEIAELDKNSYNMMLNMLPGALESARKNKK